MFCPPVVAEMAASRLCKVSRVMVLVCFSWLGHSCAQLPPYAANGGTFHVTDRPSGMDGHPKGPDCPERQSSACRGGTDSVLKAIGRSVARLEEIQQENKATMFRLVASVNAVRQSLERGMPCIATTNGFGEAIKEFNGQVKVIGFDEQISRVVGAIDSLKNRENECCNSDVVSLGIEQKKLSDAVQELRKRIDTLEKKDGDGKKGTIGDLVVIFLALLGCIWGWILACLKHWFFGSKADYGNDAARLAASKEEISEGYRHYSNLRFAMFTLFVAINGALGVLEFGKEYVDGSKVVHPSIPIVGVLVTLAFACMEFVIDKNQTEYFNMARAIWKWGGRASAGTKGSIALGARTREVSKWNCLVRIPIWGIFGIVLGLWLHVIFV